MIRLLIPFLLIALTSASFLPEVTSYAKVSKNGQEQKNTGGLIPWITRALSRNNETESQGNEGRSVQDIVLTMSPIYVTPRTPKLHNGEAIDYTTRRYSTLDHDLIASLDSMKSKKVQDRYHPAPLRSKNNGQSITKQKGNGKRPVVSTSDLVPAPGMDSFDFSKPPYSGSFDYKPVDLSDKPISKPISMDDYSSDTMGDMKPSEGDTDEDSGDDDHDHDHNHDHDHDEDDDHHHHHQHNDDDHFSNFPPDYPGPHGRPHIIVEPYEYHHGVLYDHIPDFHDHHHHMEDHKEDQTEAPEMNDQRLDKRPYSYYFIGRKLWYIPLYFSIYFIIYVAALVLKSIARHKITLPAHLAEVASHSRMHADPSWWDYIGRLLEEVENFAEKFGRVS